MKKRILAMLLAMCCLVAVLCVLCGCNTTATNTDGANDSFGASNNNSPLAEVKNNTPETDGVDGTDTALVSSNTEEDEGIVSMEGHICPYPYTVKTNSLAEIEQYLRQVSKNTPFCMLLFDADDLLPCFGVEKDFLQTSIYKFCGMKYNGDRDPYVFREKDMSMGIYFETKEDYLQDPSKGGREHLVYDAYFCEKSFTKDDVRFVEVDHNRYRPLAGDYYGTFIRLAWFEVYAGSEVIADFYIICPDEIKYMVLQELYDRIVIIDTLNK